MCFAQYLELSRSVVTKKVSPSFVVDFFLIVAENWYITYFILGTVGFVGLILATFINPAKFRKT